MIKVIGSNNQQLADCKPARARKLIKSGKAVIVSRDPFTIKLQPKFKAPDQSIQRLIDDGALVVCNNSGGKDSQAMLAYLRQFVPSDQLLVVHAHLPDVEWDGVIDHIHTMSRGLKVEVVQATKTFFEMVDHRQKWPSAQYRQCTSDLKRGPIEKAVRHAVKNRDNKVVLNCMGLRADESCARAKRSAWTFNKRNSKAGRTWYDWLPIHDWSLDQVKDAIKAVGQHVHPVYNKGMTRLSCSFCIMASTDDLRRAAMLRPELYKRICDKEREIGHTFLMPKKGQDAEYLDQRLKLNVIQ